MGLGSCVLSVLSELVAMWLKLGTLSGLPELFTVTDRHAIRRAPDLMLNGMTGSFQCPFVHSFIQ